MKKENEGPKERGFFADHRMGGIWGPPVLRPQIYWRGQE